MVQNVLAQKHDADLYKYLEEYIWNFAPPKNSIHDNYYHHAYLKHNAELHPAHENSCAWSPITLCRQLISLISDGLQ